MSVQDLWVEEPLEGNPDWLVASRVIGDERGIGVIAEIRVFPMPATDDRLRAVGDWDAEVLGCRARPVPRRGITPTMVRKSLAAAVSAHATAAASASQMHGNMRKASRACPDKPQFSSASEAFEAAGITPLDPVSLLKQSMKAQSGARRGAPAKWAPVDYARFALTYDDAVRASKSPIQEIMREHRLKHAQARNLIARARQHGFIRPVAQGSAGKPLPESDRQRLLKFVARNRKGQGK